MNCTAFARRSSHPIEAGSTSCLGVRRQIIRTTTTRLRSIPKDICPTTIRCRVGLATMPHSSASAN
jgi:hypothetical protein